MSKNYPVNPIRLEPEAALKILSELPQEILQGRRMFEYLSQHPHASTGELTRNCNIGNLSDIAHCVNPCLYKYGLIIACTKPAIPTTNSFSEKCRSKFLWSVYAIPKTVANDESYFNDNSHGVLL
jgi:hypothetical protein